MVWSYSIFCHLSCVMSQLALNKVNLLILLQSFKIKCLEIMINESQKMSSRRFTYIPDWKYFTILFMIQRKLQYLLFESLLCSRETRPSLKDTEKPCAARQCSRAASGRPASGHTASGSCRTLLCRQLAEDAVQNLTNKENCNLEKEQPITRSSQFHCLVKKESKW